MDYFYLFLYGVFSGVCFFFFPAYGVLLVFCLSRGLGDVSKGEGGGRSLFIASFGRPGGGGPGDGFGGPGGGFLSN